MARPTFPARNQWSGDVQGTPRVNANAARQAVRLPATDWLAPVLPQATPPQAQPHRVAVQARTTAGGAGLANADALRARMVQQLQRSGISDVRVLSALQAVPRHCFVDGALLDQAYKDTSLPIGLQQTISKPGVVARMVELLLACPAMQALPGDARLGRVLEIGTGCGYQASVLGQVATEVYSIERLRGLHEKARSNLRPFRIANVHLILGDGMLGYPLGAPYAGIIAAAGGHAIPQAWIDQLAMGGRIVAPLVSGQGQVLVALDKTPQGLHQSVLEPVLFVPLKSGMA